VFKVIPFHHTCCTDKLFQPHNVDEMGALKMQDRKMTDKDIAGGGKCRTGI